MRQIILLIAFITPCLLSGQVVLQESFWTGTYIEKDGSRMTHRGTIKLFEGHEDALNLYWDGKRDGDWYSGMMIVGSACVIGGLVALNGETRYLPLTLSLAGLTFTIIGASKYSQRRKKWNRAVALYNQ